MTDEKLIIISDAHLGAQSRADEQIKANRLLSFLQSRVSAPSRLIICGDLFDFWFEYRYAVPRRHFSILAQLSLLVRNGVRIDYIAGNHDFWLGSFLEQEVGLHLHRDDLELEQAGKKIYLRHGDGLIQKDHGYRALKKVLRHPFNVFLYRLLHPDVGVPLALFFSQLSRNADKAACFKTDNEYRSFAFQKIEQGYDLVVLGHSHMPACTPYRQGWYVNAGDWIKAFTFVEIVHGRPALYRWDGQARKIAPDTDAWEA